MVSFKMLAIDGKQNCFYSRGVEKSITNLPVKDYFVSNGDRGLLSQSTQNYVGNPGLHNEHSLVGNLK